MNKNVLAVFAAVCGLFMASCGTPSDYRPDVKVSVDYVEPGTRNTHNVGKVNDVHGESEKEEYMPGHMRGGNSIQPGDSVSEEVETNSADMGTLQH
ncbi:hypothetical protein ACFSKU_17085 [Pontibacter silvestris]|uniref:Secreted protein n=1 Tax=Pontibacter silvestris TaxID=2305183 RepID=A0ABW4X375_9BACT|nr:hypothetical protein [Pontibacter silvestris]MCC9135739.1 hypothetical protein [Pontibacter silvestris]